jgi:hypothetical protein
MLCGSVGLGAKVEWDGPVSDFRDGTAPFSVWLTRNEIDPDRCWIQRFFCVMVDSTSLGTV